MSQRNRPRHTVESNTLSAWLVGADEFPPEWVRAVRGLMWAALAYSGVLLFNTEDPLAALAVVMLAIGLLGSSESEDSATSLPLYASRPAVRRRHKARRPARILADHRHVLLAQHIIVPPVRRTPRIVRSQPPPRRPHAPGSQGHARRGQRLVRRYG